MNDLPWWIKAGIGAIGGLALAMLKLIDAKFFLASIATVEAHAAYLTYFCYMVLGSLAAVFLTDHELPAPKVRRGAFILGLLAPSVLLAIANQPFKPGSIEKESADKQIPTLGWMPLPSALAQEVKSTKGPVNVISKEKLEPSFGDAFSAALGRSTLKEPYAYVIGSTDDKQKAILTAGKLREFLASDTKRPVSFETQVLQVAGDKKFYVLMGGIDSKESLVELKVHAASASIGALGSESPKFGFSLMERKSLANLIADAPVVPAKNLATVQ